MSVGEDLLDGLKDQIINTGEDILENIFEELGYCEYNKYTVLQVSKSANSLVL